MPCAVCNQMIEVPLKTDFYHTEPVEEIPSAIYDYSEALRESILIELPKPLNVKEIVRQEKLCALFCAQRKRSEKTTYFPFADMENP